MEPRLAPWRPRTEFRQNVRTAIIGGGIAGCSVAFHLAQRGESSVQLLEQNEIAAGTTWHAAGLVSQFRSSPSLARINQTSVEVYRDVAEQVDWDIGWRQVGSVMIGRDSTRMAQLIRTYDRATTLGIEAHLLDTDGVARRWPGLLPDMKGGVWVPEDAKVQPQLLTLALAKLANDKGVAISEKTEVSEIRQAHPGFELTTSQGSIFAEQIVLCAGMWMHQFGSKLGIPIPLHPVQHHYVISRPVPGLHNDLPVVRDYARSIYYRSEEDRIILGAFQLRSHPWTVSPVPRDFRFGLLDEDWPSMEEPIERALMSFHNRDEIEFEEFINGPESFTPDHQFILSPIPDWPGGFIAGGFNSAGIATAGGAGKIVADWIVDGASQVNTTTYDLQRFQDHDSDLEFLRERVSETLGLHYEVAWPNREFETGRNRSLSPIHASLLQMGAVMGSKQSWETPLYFRTEGLPEHLNYTFGRPDWTVAVAEEIRARQETAAVWDLSSYQVVRIRFSKSLALESPRLATPTVLLNSDDQIVAETTLLAGTDEALLLIPPSHVPRTLAWLAKQSQLEFETLDPALVLHMAGPKSDELLHHLAPKQNDHSPGIMNPCGNGTWSGSQDEESYLIMPASEGRSLINAGQLEASLVKLNGRMAGAYANLCLRCMSGQPQVGSDWTLLAPPIHSDASDLQLVHLATTDEQAVAWGGEPVYCGTQSIGAVTSAAFDPLTGTTHMLAGVQNVDGQLSVTLFGKSFPVEQLPIKLQTTIWKAQ